MKVVHCDFCYTAFKDEDTWTYEIEPFSLSASHGMRPYQDDGHWAICDTCHGYIQAKDKDGLLAYSVACDPAASKVPAMVEWKRRLIRAFFAARWLGPPYKGPVLGLIDGQHR